MSAAFERDGDRWEIGVEEHSPRTGVRAVVFHCVSNPQRPYRVTEVPEDELEGGVPGGDRLNGIFDRSHIMDYTHDAGGSVGQRPGEAAVD